MESETKPIPNSDGSPHKAETTTADGKGDQSTKSGDQENNPDQVQENQESSREKPEGNQEIIHTLESTSKDVDVFLTSNHLDKTKEGRSDSESCSSNKSLEIPKNVEKFLDLVEEKIAKHERNGKLGQDKNEDSSFFDAVSRITSLSKLIRSEQSHDHGALINRISSIHQRVMSFLEDEFRTFLEEYWKIPELDHHKHDSDQQNHDPVEINYPGYPDETVSNLHNIAKSMITGGHEFECCEIYMIARRDALDECLHKISGFEKVSIDEIQKMHWESLEKEITIWCKTFKQCSTIFFSGEHKLAKFVFHNIQPSMFDSLFSNLTRGVVIQLLNFAEGVAITKRSIEKLFKILDMYEALRDNAKSVHILFPEQCGDELESEIDTVRIRLGEEAVLIFSDLETSIKNDQGKTPVPGGSVHPLTRYTLNYLRFSCDQYRETLDQIFKEHSKPDQTEPAQTDLLVQTAFTNQLIRVMDLLDSNLESKSKLYKDISLSCIFMMNNGRYILQKVKGSSDASQKLGDTWIRKKSSELRNYHKSYQRETWTKLLGCLTHEGLMDRSGKIVKPNLKERFKNFNSKFEEIHKAQSSWVVRDEQLKSELRVSISSVVIPAYRSFLGRFSQFLDPGRQTEKYIKLQAEDIEEAIDDLFEGNPASMPKRK